MVVIENNITHNYKLYDISNSLTIHLPQIKYDSQTAYTNYINLFKFNPAFTPPGKLTGGYKFYNIFSLTAGSSAFYNVYKSIKNAIHDYLNGDFEGRYIDAWINFHKQDEVLNWHNHATNYVCHGYLSIDPKDTITEFENYQIINKPGYIYIGPSGNSHRVVVNTPYSDRRITIGFNVACLENLHKVDGIKNLSFIPL